MGAAESQEENLGYVFLTFSHSDEARMFLLENGKSYYEHYPLEVTLKSSIDHSELDRHYFLARAKNAAKTVDEIEKVRLARQELRDFEKGIDSMLPSRKKLKKFKQMAKSLIEDNKFKSRV